MSETRAAVAPQLVPDPGPAPDLSVIVVTYNSADVIEACLTSVREGAPRAEVIVVDNASSDGTEALVRARHPGVTVIQTGFNAGYSGGNNLGLGRARGRYLLVLNPDTRVLPGALDALIAFANDHPRAGLVGPRIVYPDGRLQHSCFRAPTLRMALNGFFPLAPLDSVANGRYPLDSYRQAHRVEHLLGAALLARRQLVEQIGPMDARSFPMYFEETDWCQRARLAGWEVWFTPVATVEHIQAHTTSREPERMSVAFHRSQARYYRRYLGPGGYVALKLIHVAGLQFWLARSTRGLLRGRVDRALWLRRARSYWAILWT